MRIVLFCIITIACLAREPEEWNIEGVWRLKQPKDTEDVSRMIIGIFLPYNPVIWEIGEEAGTLADSFSSWYRQGRFFSIPSFPMLRDLESFTNLPTPDWIQSEAKFVRLLFQQPFPFMSNLRGMSLITYDPKKFLTIKKYMETKSFRLITHYYHIPEKKGIAIFIHRDIYESIF